MKKLAIIVSIFLTVSIFTFSTFAMGRGMGGGMGGGMSGSSGGSGGSGMMNNFESGLLDWLQKSRNGNEYVTPPNQARKPIEELDKQHYEDSVYLKYQIQMKEKELDALLNTKDPDIDKVRSIRKDIRELRAVADQEQRNYELDAGKNDPSYRSGSSDSWYSYGSPDRHGRGDMGYGNGRDMGDYGQVQ